MIWQLPKTLLEGQESEKENIGIQYRFEAASVNMPQTASVFVYRKSASNRLPFYQIDFPVIKLKIVITTTLFFQTGLTSKRAVHRAMAMDWINRIAFSSEVASSSL